VKGSFVGESERKLAEWNMFCMESLGSKRLTENGKPGGYEMGAVSRGTLTRDLKNYSDRGPGGYHRKRRHAPDINGLFFRFSRLGRNLNLRRN